jgi:acyl-CoA thioester hydrolase
MKPDIFEKRITVSKDDIDFNGHVNNLKYLELMINSAISHSAKLGFTPKTYKEIGATWFAKSHHIEYKLPAFAGDELIIKTWIDEVKKVTSKRKYEIYKNDKLICFGETEWVYVDYETHKPKKIADDVIKKYFKGEK